jgi:hypothetical protein
MHVMLAHPGVCPQVLLLAGFVEAVLQRLLSWQYLLLQ